MERSSKIWKLFFGSGSVTAFNALRAFVINKLLAVFLPPAAFACVGQFLNFMSIGQATSSLAMQNGWVSLTAQNKDDPRNLHGVWRGGFRLTTFATLITCVAAAIFCFAAPLESFFPGINPHLVQTAILFALPGIFATNIVTITASVMNGLGNLRRWAIINILTSLWQVVWVAFFLYTGFLSVLSIIATQSIVAGILAACLAARAGFSFKHIRMSVLDIRAPWVSYALMGIVPMVLTPVVLSFVRSHIGTTMGWNAAGIWQGIYKISDFFASLLSATLGVVLLPKITDRLTRKEFHQIFFPVFGRMVVLSLALVAVLYVFRGVVVSVFLSKSYAGAADYLGPQLLGDFFRSAGWCLAFVLIARRDTKAFLAIEIGAQVFFAVATYVATKKLEFQGPVVAYALENFVTLVALAFAVRRLKWNTP